MWLHAKNRYGYYHRRAFLSPCFVFSSSFMCFAVAYNSPHPQTGIVATISVHGTNYYITKRQKQEKQITWDAMFLFTFIGGLAYYGYKQTVRIQP